MSSRSRRACHSAGLSLASARVGTVKTACSSGPDKTAQKCKSYRILSAPGRSRLSLLQRPDRFLLPQIGNNQSHGHPCLH